jgi:uncharacterized beta-barrel protein YwiB (DUF1934 family)
MSRNAVISVASKQSGLEDEAIEIVTQGKFYKKDNSYYAVYDETELSGMAGTTTTIKVNKEKLTLIRLGTTNARIEFKNNYKSISMYDTPYGTLELGVETRKLDIKIDDEGGRVFVDYDMTLAGQKPLKTILEVNIKAN